MEKNETSAVRIEPPEKLLDGVFFGDAAMKQSIEFARAGELNATPPEVEEWLRSAKAPEVVISFLSRRRR